MDSKWLSSFIFNAMLFLSIWSSHILGETNIFDVNNNGAISSSHKVHSNQAQGFVDAWNKACKTNGGVFSISPGTYILSGSILFQGPCNGHTTVTINGVLKAAKEVTLPVDYWIRFQNVNNLTINGQGTLDGNGHVSWGRQGAQNPPTSLSFEKVSNVRIQDIKSVNSKMFHMKIYDSQHVTIDHVSIWAPADSTNTDGVHISRSSDVRVVNSQIATGDDCVSIGHGSSNVNIIGVSCGPGHGISVGSLGKREGEQEVSSITVTNCTLTGTTNGVRIKTYASSVPLVARDLIFQHIIMNNVKNPIITNQHYCPQQKSCPKKGQGESSVQIRGVKFIDVRGSSAEAVAVKMDCSRSKPCVDMEFSGVNLQFRGQATTAACSNADVKFLNPNQVPSKCSGPAAKV